jgi:HSP20 family protein
MARRPLDDPGQADFDPVDEALKESFPASDPPAWAAQRSVRDLPDPPARSNLRRSDMARNLPTPFRFTEDPGWAAGPFMMMQREMSRLLDDVARGTPPGAAGQGALMAPRLDVRETDNEFRVSVELPGVSEDDVEVNVDDDLLTIRAEKKEEREVERADQHITERMFGVFQRTLRLPAAADPQSIQANLQNGVLEIIIPKAQGQGRSRRVQVGRREQGASGEGGGAQAH